jgi:membrane fusion protein, multidrug efflux system
MSDDRDLGFALPEPARMSRGRAIAIGAILAIGLGGAFAVGYLPKHNAKKDLAAQPKAGDGVLRVETVTAKVLTSDRSLALPGSIQPLEETVLYARANGYVHKWYADLGDVVKEDQVLADINTPELDRDLLAARAELAKAEASILQAQANSDRAQKELERSETLAAQGLSSKQDLDQKKADVAVAKANVGVANAAAAAQRANVSRAQQLKAYSKLTAPFAGTITLRGVERGALIAAGTTTPLYKIAATDIVRVMVQVPQNVAPSVKIGLKASVAVKEFAGKPFEGTIAHSAGALDPATRMMLTEVRVPNADHKLLAGMYATVSLTLPTPHRVLELPSTALLNDASGLRVATVDASNKIHWVTIMLERDNGATIEIASGLDGNEKIVKLASPDLTEGRVVELAASAR